MLKDIIINLKKPDTWKIQLATAINIISSKDNDEERGMHSKSDKIEIMINDKESDNTEIMINDKADEVTEVFKSLQNRYPFISDCVHLLYYECHKIIFKSVGSYIDSPNRINLINLKNKSYQ